MTAPTSTEMQLHYALLRRGIAFKFARLMTFEEHNTWVQFLYQSMQRDAPPGYSRPSLHQVLACDKAAFVRFGSTMSRVRQEADGSYPLGANLLALRTDPVIALHLAPLAKSSSSSTGPPRPTPYSAQPKQQGTPSDKKGKGKGKKGKSPPMPLELRNKWHRNAQGEPLCFAYNTSKGCTAAKDGERCPKGWHQCAEPKCLQGHPLTAHPRTS